MVALLVVDTRQRPVRASRSTSVVPVEPQESVFPPKPVLEQLAGQPVGRKL